MLIASACVTPTLREREVPALAAMKPLIGPSDLVEIRVFGEKDLSGDHRVSPEGFVRLPLIGAVHIDGQTPEEAAAKITAAYGEEYLKNPQVTVNVKEFNSRKVFVLGTVKKPGAFPYEERMTVLGAIARAGGGTRLSAFNRTVLTREEPAEGGKIKKTSEVVQVDRIQRGTELDVLLRPGDVIFVPEVLF